MPKIISQAFGGAIFLNLKTKGFKSMTFPFKINIGKTPKLTDLCWFWRKLRFLPIKDLSYLLSINNNIFI